MDPTAAVDLFKLDSKTSTTGTAGETGTGLGLQLCQELLELHSSELRFATRLGHGTTFRFNLPSGAKAPVSPSNASPSPGSR